MPRLPTLAHNRCTSCTVARLQHLRLPWAPNRLLASGGSGVHTFLRWGCWVKRVRPTTDAREKVEDKHQELEALREAVQDPAQAIPTLAVKLEPGQRCLMANPLHTTSCTACPTTCPTACPTAGVRIS